MTTFSCTDAWRNAYPGAYAGFLVAKEFTNLSSHPLLDAEKSRVEQELRERFASGEKSALRGLPVLQAYAKYYKQFQKTYHVQLQVESVVWKDKTIPSHSAAVAAMFMAELKNMLLTAGHDLERIDGNIRVGAAEGSESYTLMRGESQTLKAEDMYMADDEGIISSILYGPDARTQIIGATRSAVFTVYAPAGIGAAAVRQHLLEIGRYIHLFCPTAVVEEPQIIS